MDYFSRFNSEFSDYGDVLADVLGKPSENLPRLWELLFNRESVIVAWRSLWVLEKLLADDFCREWISERQDKLRSLAMQENTTDGQRRIITSVLKKLLSKNLTINDVDVQFL
ncbi:MAG: hypothetical protein HUK15_09885, partial [Bacteroidales bacterium]|nr:hypothetical protein [Bacteroidales bacterium]